MEKLYICGDSFCTSDPEYGPNWVDLLKDRCPNIEIVNLATPGASNYLVYKQVEHALSQDCDYLIYHATSSVRQEFALSNAKISKDSIDRYWSPHNKQNKNMVSNSWLAPWCNAEELFSNDDSRVIKEFFTRFVDFSVLIEKNYVFICHTLNLIAANKKLKKWVWSQGGFQHKNFNNFNNDEFEFDFSNYKDHESKINLWDHYDAEKWRITRRPYYHITERHILENLCDYYADVLHL